MYFDGISADRPGVIRILNMLHGAELVAAHQYRQHAQKVKGFAAQGLETALLSHADEEDGHAQLVSDLIRDLGGELTTRLGDLPAFSFNGEDSVTADANGDMLAQDLHGENGAVAAYGEAVRMLKDTEFFDVAVILAGIQRDEREHAADLISYLS